MNFNNIIMNPPYSKNLHLKILAEAKKHLKNKGIVSLQPIDKFQIALLNNKPAPVEDVYVCERISMDEASSIFGINQRAELGIVSDNKNLEIDIIDNLELLKKIKIGLDKAIAKAGLLKDRFEKDYKDYPIAFGWGCTIAGHGGHGKACYRIFGKFERATEKTEIGHTKRYNAKNAAEQKKVYDFYANIMMRFIYKEFGFGNVPYEIIPFITGFVDSNGKTPMNYSWSFEDLLHYFKIDTKNELKIIEKSLHNYLYEEEQKIIESTMEKYK